MFAINRKSDFARKLEQDIQYIRLEMLMHSRAGIVHPSHENESLRGVGVPGGDPAPSRDGGDVIIRSYLPPPTYHG